MPGSTTSEPRDTGTSEKGSRAKSPLTRRRGDDPQLRARARAMRLAGATWAEMRAELRVGNGTLGQLLALGRPPRPVLPPDVREQARRLRRGGLSVPQIAKELGIARSTAWMIVKDLPSSHRAAAARSAGDHGRRYWERESRRREVERQTQKFAAAVEVGELTERELLIAGAVAYWAEGAKDKPWHRRENLQFINSDPEMIKLFLAWLRLLKVDPARLKFRLHIHESADLVAAEEFWSDVVGMPARAFARPQIKRHTPKGTRHNVGSSYFGCLQVTVAKSSIEYRRTHGLWVGTAIAAERLSLHGSDAGSGSLA